LLVAVNRLDAVTSGIVIFANVADPSVRQRFQPPHVDTDAESDPLVEKEYVCRVIGEFPQEPIVVKEPILQSAGKVMIDPSGKSSETRFVRKWFDPTSNSSLVSCKYPKDQDRLHGAQLILPNGSQWIVGSPIHPSSSTVIFRNSGRLLDNRTTTPDPTPRGTLAASDRQ
jgi:hypothetical protein